MNWIKLAHDMVHCLAFVNTGDSTKGRELSNCEATKCCDKSGNYTEVNESRHRNVRRQGDARLRPYKTEYLDHPILPYCIPSRRFVI